MVPKVIITIITLVLIKKGVSYARIIDVAYWNSDSSNYITIINILKNNLKGEIK